MLEQFLDLAGTNRLQVGDRIKVPGWGDSAYGWDAQETEVVGFEAPWGIPPTEPGVQCWVTLRTGDPEPQIIPISECEKV